MPIAHLHINGQFLEEIAIIDHLSRTALMRTRDLLINSDAVDDIPQKAGLAVIVLVLTPCDEYFLDVFAAMDLVLADLAVLDVLEGIGDRFQP